MRLGEVRGPGELLEVERSVEARASRILDHPERFGDVDLAGALADVEGTPNQWEQAGALPVPHVDLTEANALVMAGVGGSGIVGDLVAAMGVASLPCPVHVCRDAALPAFVGPRTVVIAVSHSGNSTETLLAAEEALARCARLLVVTSGGALGERALAAGAPRILVPPGRPPRHSLAALFVPVLRALGLDGVTEAVAVLRTLVGQWARHIPQQRNEAKQLGAQLASPAVPIIYGAAGLAGVAAYRLKSQLNENAERPAFTNTLPELCHNEIVGWQHSGSGPGWGLVCFRDPEGETPLVARRAEATLGLIAQHCAWVATPQSTGHSRLARLASMILLGDLASVYAALLLGRDPTPIEPILRLKRELSGG